jgi:hypothetical protein
MLSYHDDRFQLSMELYNPRQSHTCCVAAPPFAPGQAEGPKAVAALPMTGQNFRKVMGYRDLETLESALDRKGVSLQGEVA